jgi:hypothetical protein
MRKSLLALATGAVLVAGTLAPTAADARCRGCGIAAGILGGLILGGAIAHAYPYSDYPVADYETYPAQAGADSACPGGYWARRPLLDRYGNVVGYTRPRYFCPGY